MENRAHALAAGLFTLVLGLALVAAFAWFQGDNRQEKQYLLATTLSLSGLNPQAAVRYRGLQVGRVESIDFDPQQPRALLIRIAVRSDTPITRSTYAELAYQGLTGLSYIQLDDDGSSSTPLESLPGSLARIEMRPSRLQEVGMTGELLLARLGEVTERASRVLSDENLAHVKGTLANVEAVSSRLVALQKKLDPALEALPGVASEARTTLEGADSLIAELRTLTREVQSRMAALDQVAAGAQKLGDAGEAVSDEVLATLPKFGNLLDSLTRATRRLDNLVSRLEEQPQSLLFGRPRPQPGPGEPGFSVPR